MYLGILIFCPFQWGRCILRLAFWKYSFDLRDSLRTATRCHSMWGDYYFSWIAFYYCIFVWYINSTTTQEFRCIVWNHYVLYRITAAYKWSQSWARWIYSTLLHHVSLRSISSCRWRIGIPRKLLPSIFPTSPHAYFSSLPYASRGHSYYTRFDCPNDIWVCAQIIKLIIIRFSLDFVKFSWV